MSLALVASFLVLVFASLVSSVQFGLLSAFVMAMALIGELTLTPVLMGTMRLVTLWDMLLLKMNVDVIRHAPLFEGLSRWEARKIVLLGKLEAVAAGSWSSGRVRDGRRDVHGHHGTSAGIRSAARRTESRAGRAHAGAVFGEMALVTREVRSASVMAATNAEVLRLDFAALERIRRRFPTRGRSSSATSPPTCSRPAPADPQAPWSPTGTARRLQQRVPLQRYQRTDVAAAALHTSCVRCASSAVTSRALAGLAQCQAWRRVLLCLRLSGLQRIWKATWRGTGGARGHQLQTDV